MSETVADTPARAAFEEWIRSVNRNADLERQRHSPDLYYIETYNRLWEGWEAGAAYGRSSRDAEVARLVDALKDAEQFVDIQVECLAAEFSEESSEMIDAESTLDHIQKALRAHESLRAGGEG